MIYEIFISVVIVLWAFSGMFLFFITVGEPPIHAEAPAVLLFYIMPAFMCAGLGPFTGIFWVIKKVSQRYAS